VRISSVDNPRVVGKFEGTFEGYWADPEFEPYEPVRDGGRFEEAVREALGERGDADERVTFFDLRPYPFQQEILDRLAAERDGRERHRNLVVAATGTGKTLVAALDYARLGQAPGGAPPTLLFIAHREELLVQSRAVFRQALRDRAFGEMLVGGARPLAGSHVFASIQSLARIDLARLRPDAYDVVIVDEFHHAAAPTYARLLAHLRPKELLGLTATPERADGESVLDWFDGRVAAEVRLWDAIDRGLLCPFQYFGVRDQVDLDLVTWRRGYVPSELEDLYTADDARVMLVLEAVRERVAAPRRMRALGFCVSVRHAEFMASRFTERGVPARAVTGLNTVEQRRAAISALQRQEVNVLFTVDLFNEGVDLPWVDTILALRPTESATIFLQQLGRGLRLHRGKECLTVLDFIGKQHDRFRFDHRFRALTNATRAGLIEQIEQGFPRLPSGCAIHLEPEAMRIVLDNVQRVIRAGSIRLVEELRAVARARGGDVSLAEFLREASLELGVIYRNGRTFTALRRAAGLPTPPEGPAEREMGKVLGRLLHLDDPGRIARIAAVIREGAVIPRDEAARRERLMLGAALLGPSGPQVLDKWLGALKEHPALRGEMLDLLGSLAGEAPRLPRPFTALHGVPLSLHCRYLLAEVMAAFGSVSANGQRVIVPQTGVYWHKPTNAELLFVTLQKSARHYSPSTMYEDYAISPTEFHWQSQNHVTTASAAGKRHIDHRSLGVTPLLFVRHTKHDDRGNAAPYVFLGPVEHVSHRGERPISIVWRLPTPMPADLFRDVKLAAG
jgi:superfamily II DNA or RNA helicase